MKRSKRDSKLPLEDRIFHRIENSAHVRKVANRVVDYNSYLQTQDKKLKSSQRKLLYLSLLGFLMVIAVIVPLTEKTPSIGNIGVIQGPIANEKFVPDAFQEFSEVRDGYKFLDSLGKSTNQMLFETKRKNNEK
jgi:hypothetical protein